LIQLLGLVLTYSIVYLMPLSLFGYLIAGVSGVIWAGLLSFSLSSFCLLFGDSWLLALSHSIPLKKSDALWEKSLNLVSVKDLKNLSLYECRKYPHIVCSLSSAFGKNSLIIGSEILKNFSEREKTLLMELSTNYLKIKPSFLRTQFSLALALIINLTSFNADYRIYKKVPRIIRKLLSPFVRVLNILIILLKFLFFPLGEAKKHFIRYEKPYEQIETDSISRADLIAVVRKLQISNSRTRYVRELAWHTLNDLSLIPLGDDSSFMFNHYKAELEK